MQLKYKIFFLLITTIVFAQQKIKHKVVSGESVYTIAKKYKVTEKEIFDLNPKAKGVLALNTELIIPKPSKKPETPQKKALKGANVYTVQNGESFYTISRKFNVGYETLTEANPDIKPENLQIGTTIVLPKGVKIAKSTEEKKTKIAVTKTSKQEHKVQSGESFYTLAKKYHTSMDELRVLNPQVENDKLDINDILFVPKQKVETSEKKLEKKKKEEKNIQDEVVEKKSNTEIKVMEAEEISVSGKHTVNKGETKFGIAKKYNLTIKELENLNPNLKELKTGQILVVTTTNDKTVDNNEHVTQEVDKEKREETKLVDTLATPEYTASMGEKADFLINKSANYIGTRYRSGGTDTNGFDCSGFMYFTFKFLGMNLPHSSIDQATVGTRISRENAKKGDLIFFKTTRRSIGHVGMITEITDSDIKFIHSSTSQGVIISSINEGYYSRRFVQINRVL